MPKVTALPRKVGLRLPGKENSNSFGARTPSHLDDEVDSDQLIVNKELSLCPHDAQSGHMTAKVAA
jgi:hypothetical protein